MHGYIDRVKGDLMDNSDIHSTEDCPAINVVCKYTKKIVDRQENRTYRCPVIDMSQTDRSTVQGIDPLFTVVGYVQ